MIGQCTYTDANGKTWTETKHSTTTIEIIRVKYDFGELWRWATILDRFAVSAGNTIGIVDAKVGWNRSPDLYLNGLSQAKRVRDRRETINIYAREPQRVAAALPELLLLLGIPVDAVGIITPSFPTDVY